MAICKGRSLRLMDFFLVRHGEAKSELEDPRRPLSPAGRMQVEKVSRALLARKVAPLEILHSDKLRARETAEILSRALSPRGGMKEIAGLRPQDDPFLIRSGLEAAEGSLMLVGHLPHLAQLVSLLVHADTERSLMDFPPAGVVCLARGQNRWEVAWTLQPELI